jgi:VIT1/CCC1 family predicted Fe2+/Mn2+ transporter
MDPKRATTPEERHELREVVGLFDTVDTLQSAIDDLLTGGFDRSEISLLAEEDKVREKLGDTDVSADSLEDSPRAPRTPYIDNESLNIGKASIVGVLFYVGVIVGAGVSFAWGLSLTSAIAVGLLTGGGAGVLGLVISKLVGDRQTKWAQSQLKHGGLLLWARVWNDERERAAMEIMQRHGGRDVHAHVGA